jgi:hypothetical protein
MLTVPTWTANIRLNNGKLQKVSIQADTFYNAKALLEAQYGYANVVLLFGCRDYNPTLRGRLMYLSEVFTRFLPTAAAASD